jgi:hypothetical protein
MCAIFIGSPAASSKYHIKACVSTNMPYETKLQRAD